MGISTSLPNNLKFDFKSKGEETGTVYEGVFTIKVKLSMNQRLREDEFRRNVLGLDAQNAGAMASSLATALAYLNVRITDAPSWWKDSNGGLNLEDFNIVGDVYNKASGLVEAEYEKLAKEAEAAQGELKKQLE